MTAVVRLHTPAPPATDGPFSLDAEQAVLGAILINNAAFGQVTGFLRPEHFAEPIHREIFAAIVSLIEAGRRADPITLRPSLPAFDADGMTAAAYLAHLAASPPTIINALDYGRVIYELAVRRALLAIGEDMTSLASIPPGGMDAFEQLADAERRIIQIQTDWPDPRAMKRGLSLDDVLADAEDRRQTGRSLRGAPSGIADLDSRLGGFSPGDLIVVGARPSMGKTLVALSIARRAAHAGVGAGFDSIEMSEQQCQLRLLSDEAETIGAAVPYKKIGEGRYAPEEAEALKRAAERLKRLPLVLIDQGNRLSDIPNHIRTARRKLKARGKELSLFLIDYLGLISPGDRYKGQRVHEVTEISSTLKALAKREGICIIALHQLNRANESRGDRRPILSDLRDSGSLEQDADVVLFVHREAYYFERAGYSDLEEPERIAKYEACQNDLEIIIAKQRQGPIGVVRLWCNPALNAVRDKARG